MAEKHVHTSECNHEQENNSIHIDSEQEMMMKASVLENYDREISEKIEYLSQHLAELEEFLKDIDFLSKSNEKKIFSSIGKGIYLKSSIENDNLFVNVGAGVIVKKTPQEAKEIIETQVRQFHDAKTSLLAQKEVYTAMLSSLLSEMQNSKK